MSESQKRVQKDLERYKEQQKPSRPSVPVKPAIHLSKKGVLLGKKLLILLLNPKVLVVVILSITTIVSFPFIKEQVQKVVDIIKPSKKYEDCLSVWGSHISKAAEKYSIDPALIGAIMWQESKCNPEALGEQIKDFKSKHFGTRAIGLMQIMPLTARDVCNIYQPSRLWDPATNIHCGAMILAGLIKDLRCQPKYKGDYFRIAAGYFGGPGACTRASLDVTLNKGTEEYAREVLQHYAVIAEIWPTIAVARLYSVYPILLAFR